MTGAPDAVPIHDPLAAKLSGADDRILLSHWLPPQLGIVPRIRVGQRWISTLWALPLGFAALMLVVALAQSLREYPDVKAFIVRHPGIAQSAPSVDSGFPWWLRLQHFLNMLFMMFIIRAGIQILADHPRLYWKRGLHAGHRLVPLPAPGANRKDLDRQGRLRDVAKVAGHPGAAPFHRLGPLVALLH